ncbi:copper chaperone CopZ [Aquibacillus salsiterrae]|uniref:Copper chaperone CopZ n=1 Tax=Aquibacillus salsiterrae TaxID=2950439 RepID=A0A9X3WDH9_9BACI|nr:copper chaperone CopZ [Aquibacillus salsiterrae]MDC3417013.1 copper chaperone CopZ [Aquibacillus salsiterrae]
MEKITLSITGMSCNHCVNKVENALNEQDGVEKVKVNLKKGTAVVKFDESKQTLDQLTAAVSEVGYEAIPEN